MSIQEQEYQLGLAFKSWIAERCDTSEKMASVRTSDLLNSFRAWLATRSDPTPVNRIFFVDLLKRAGLRQVQQYRSHPQMVAGIRLRAS